MWDQLLIFLAIHPFLACFFALLVSILLFQLGNKSNKFRWIGVMSLALTLGLASILHLRWDSFSIHFTDVNPKDVKTKQLLFIGDSITCEGTRPRGFITKLQSLLSIKAHVLCERGAKTHQIMQFVENSAFELPIDLIIVQSGINDFIDGSSDEQTLDAQRKLIASIRSKFPKSIIWFLPIHPFYKDGELISPKPSALSSDFANWWESYKSFPQNALVSDGIHLNARGHTCLTSNLAKKLASFPKTLFESH